MAAAFALAATAIVVFAEWKLSRLVVGGLGEGFSTKIYSAPMFLGGDVRVGPDRVLARLRRDGYRVAASTETAAGEFVWDPPRLSVHLRGFRTPRFSQAEELATLKVDSGNAWTVSDSSANSVVGLEPELVAEISGASKVRREPTAWAEIPDRLKQAVIAVEDKRFYHHWGLDPRAMLRAAWHDVRRPGEIYGASTITQQYAKNFFLSPSRTLRRKLAEAALAVYLELRYSKEKILTLYLNQIYLGQDGSVSVAGVKAAARFYFGKDLKDLDLAQCALLAGVVRSPYLYNPFRDPEAAKRRRDFVLARMRVEGYIDSRELAQAQDEPLGIAYAKGPKPSDESYFVAEVLRQLVPRYGEDVLFRQGLSIYTTMDPQLQAAAERALRRGRLQDALVALDFKTGDVLALAGGREFKETQFNRATQARRQPGSAFKPFVYGAALEKGWTAASILQDKPQVFKGLSQQVDWKPRNYDGIYLGSATVRDAIAHSLNAATIDLAEKIGSQTIIDFARRLGIESPLDSSLAMSLGDSEVTLLELTSAYAPFANGGFRERPRLVEGVFDADRGDGQRNVLEVASDRPEPVIEPGLAYVMTSLLEGVVQHGTAKNLAAMGWKLTAAGKTGTTNGGRDAWFIGYTPRLLAGVWAGDDLNRRSNLSGAKDAVPLWAAFMKDATRDDPVEEFPEPKGVKSVVIDPASGLLARSGCPVRRTETFIAGTEPTAYCPLHPGGIAGFFKRWFGRP